MRWRVSSWRSTSSSTSATPDTSGTRWRHVRCLDRDTWHYTDTCLQVVILVANKADQVRSREIKSTAGKQMAVKYGVKYIETSPGEGNRL